MCVCAVVASNTAVDDPQQARSLGHASIGLSIAGIVVSVVVVVISVALALSADDDDVASASSSSSSCPSYKYYKYGTCYNSRRYVGSYINCSGVKYSGYCYYY